MNEFGRRTDEELAEALYGKRESRLPPTGEPEPEAAAAAEEQAEGEGEEPDYVETEDRSGLRPVAKDGLGMMASDDRLMKFLEDDIDAMEAEQEVEERRVEKNWNQKS